MVTFSHCSRTILEIFVNSGIDKKFYFIFFFSFGLCCHTYYVLHIGMTLYRVLIIIRIIIIIRVITLKNAFCNF